MLGSIKASIVCLYEKYSQQVYLQDLLIIRHFKNIFLDIIAIVVVVDIYQEWCGPCKAMASIFRRIKNEIGDDLLHFAVVC